MNRPAVSPALASLAADPAVQAALARVPREEGLSRHELHNAKRVIARREARDHGTKGLLQRIERLERQVARLELKAGIKP